MSAILVTVVSFLMQALALKLALGMLGQASAENKYSKAIGVAALLNVAGFVLAIVPFGGLFYALLWLGVIMTAYRVGFFRSLGVAVLQVGVRFVLGFVLSLIGFSSGLFGF